MSTSVFLPNYTIGTDAYEQIAEICKPFGNKITLIGGETALHKSSNAIHQALEETEFQVLEEIIYGHDATYENVSRLEKIAAVQQADMLFAVGGGRAVDTVKTLAEKLNKPIFTFPTIASNCAANTAVSVMYEENGEMAGLFFLKSPAKHCFIHTGIIAEAPDQYLWAGIADAISKEYESAFSARDKELNYNDALGVQVVKHSAARLMHYGKDALTSCKENRASFALEQVCLDILMTTALTSVLVQNDYNSSAAHSFYYGATVLESCETHLHGEIVCYGVLVLLTMDQQIDERNRLYAFMDSIGLSTSLQAIGVQSEAALDLLLNKAMTTVDIQCAPYTITKQRYLEAIHELEAYQSTLTV